MEQGDRPAAIRCLREAAWLAPHYKTLELLGECLRGEGREPEAVLYLAAAAGLGRKQARARFLLAGALLACGQHYAWDAAQQLRECLRVSPNFKTARELLERVLRENPDVAQRMRRDEETGANDDER